MPASKSGDWGNVRIREGDTLWYAIVFDDRLGGKSPCQQNNRNAIAWMGAGAGKIQTADFWTSPLRPKHGRLKKRG